MPFIGHTGICTSAGVIYDFAGPYYISEDNMGFGWPTKYWQLDPAAMRGGAAAFDAAVAEANAEYRTRMHNLCCDNCHSHVARALSTVAYGGRAAWSMVFVGLYVTLFGRYVSVGAFLRTWLPFLVIMLCLGIGLGVGRA